MRTLEWVWSPRERRVRAVVRLVGQFVLYLALLGASSPLINSLFIADVGAMPLGRHALGGPIADAVSGTVSLVAALVSVTIAARWLDRRRLRDLGLTLNWQWWRDLLAGLALGAALAGGLFVALLAAGWAEVTDVSVVPAEVNPAFVAALVLIGVVGTAIAAELLARGYQLTNIAEGLTGWLGRRGSVRTAVLISAALSGLLYATGPLATVLGTASMIAAGLFFATGYALTGRLSLPLGAHLAWNLVRGPLLAFPNEDMGANAASLLVIEPTGPELVTGNALGPEARLAGACGLPHRHRRHAHLGPPHPRHGPTRRLHRKTPPRPAGHHQTADRSDLNPKRTPHHNRTPIRFPTEPCESGRYQSVGWGAVLS